MDGVAGYVRAYACEADSCEIQVQSISRYASRYNLSTPQLYIDKQYCLDYRLNSDWIQQRKDLGLNTYRGYKLYTGWQQLMTDISAGTIKHVLVDTKLRLYDGDEQRCAFERLIHEHNVKVVETGGAYDAQGGDSIVMVYHQTSTKTERFRSRICLKEIDELYSFAKKNYPEAVIRLSFDETLQGRTKINDVETTAVKAVVVKDLFHLNRSTMEIISLVARLRKNGTDILSLKDGLLSVDNKLDYGMNGRSIRAVIYDCIQTPFDEVMSEIQEDKFNAFCRCHVPTWSVINRYKDNNMEDSSHPELVNMMRDKDMYDVVIVDSTSKLNKGIRGFMRIIQEIKKPIYSLQEGMVIVNGGDSG